MAQICDYPFHVGITATGLREDGIVKSAIGIGTLLSQGIGDTIRVSLTSDPVEEVKAAKTILQSLGLRRFGPEIMSCPTCGRCRVDVGGIVRELKERVTDKRPVKIAVMGCEVNGPGEARGAYIGIAAGRGSGALFRGGKIIKRVKEADFVKELLRELKVKSGKRKTKTLNFTL
jgi:(E)-4-hydroxy-3-methylbut-2-enyl-diphosphate synthase